MVDLTLMQGLDDLRFKHRFASRAETRGAVCLSGAVPLQPVHRSKGGLVRPDQATGAEPTRSGFR